MYFPIVDLIEPKLDSEKNLLLDVQVNSIFLSVYNNRYQFPLDIRQEKATLDAMQKLGGKLQY